MYQDFEILFGDSIPRNDQWDHTWIDWVAHMFLEYQLQRPTTALSASLIQFYIASP